MKTQLPPTRKAYAYSRWLYLLFPGPFVMATSIAVQVEPEDLVALGLTILDQGGSPGSPNQQVVIRGVNTIYTPPGQVNIGVSDIGNNQSLVIVDGIAQPYQNINPAEIESISVWEKTTVPQSIWQ